MTHFCLMVEGAIVLGAVGVAAVTVDGVIVPLCG